MSDVKEIGSKTAGGIVTYIGTYLATLTVADVQAYSVIFASVATGIYYMAATWKALKNKKDKKNAPPK